MCFPPILPLFNFNDFCHLCKYDKCHKKTVDSIFGYIKLSGA